MLRPCVAEDQVVVARMNHDVAHRDRRQILQMHPHPLISAVEGNVQAELAADVKQLADSSDLPSPPICNRVGQIAADVGEGLAEIGGLVEVRMEIVEPVMFERHVGRAGGGARRLNPGDLGELRNARARWPVTLVQCLPPSRVICRLPSSVPAQITPACTGDSAMRITVQ